MKNYILFSLTVFCFLFSNFSFAQLSGTSYSEAKTSKTAELICVYDNTKGFAYRTEEGKMAGVLVELMTNFEAYVRSKTGIQLKVAYEETPTYDFKEFMAKVKEGNGGVFGLSNVSIKEERKEYYLFSPAYLTNVSVLISNSTFPTLASMDEINRAFNQKMAYSVKETTYMDRLLEIKENHFSGMQITYLSTVDEVMEKIVGDKSGFGIVDLHYYFDFLSTRKPVKRHKVGDKIDEEFGIIMPLNNDWAPLLTEYMNGGILSSQEYKKIVQENLGLGGLRLIIER